VTKYGGKDRRESHAEGCSLFLPAPAPLKSWRPATFDCLDKNLPK